MVEKRPEDAMSHDHQAHHQGAGNDEHAAHAGHEMADHAAHAGHEMADHAGHDKHAGHSVAMFRDKFWLSVVLTIPVLVWSEVIQEWLGYTAPSFALSDRI